MSETIKRVASAAFNYTMMALFCLAILIVVPLFALRNSPEHIDGFLRLIEKTALFIIHLFQVMISLFQ